jgi:hypothetical protein
MPLPIAGTEEVHRIFRGSAMSLCRWKQSQKQPGSKEQAVPRWEKREWHSQSVERQKKAVEISQVQIIQFRYENIFKTLPIAPAHQNPWVNKPMPPKRQPTRIVDENVNHNDDTISSLVQEL